MTSTTGESIRGEKINCDGRKISDPTVYARAGGHRGKRVTVKGDPAYCTVVIPWFPGSKERKIK